MERQAHVITHEEGEPLWFFGTLLRFKASDNQTGGHFSLAEQLGRRGVATPLHRQPQDDETFYVLEGEMHFYLADGEPISAQAGTTVYLPGGTVHAFEVMSDTARWLDLTTPNHEAFIRAVSVPASELTLPPDGPPDMEKVNAVAQQFGVEILGPPPGAHH